MTEPGRIEEDRATLAQLEDRLRRDVSDMLAVLEVDLPAFVRRTARRAFTESAQADQMSPAEVRALKVEAEALATRAGKELLESLRDPRAWAWPGPEAPPASGADLEAHPGVAPALQGVADQVHALLQRHGVATPAGACRYRPPTWFVAGRFMKSLIEGWWRTLALHWEVQERVQQAARGDERQRREARWDGA